MRHPSMLVLGRDPLDCRSVCEHLGDLDVKAQLESSSANVVCDVGEDTLAIVVVEEDPERATRVCRSLRRWAHESFFPILALTSSRGSPHLWRAATTVLEWHRDTAEFIQVVGHMRRHAAQPSSPEVLEAWEIREALRAEAWLSYPMTFDLFVSGGGVLCSGLVAEEEHRERVHAFVRNAAPHWDVCTAGVRVRPWSCQLQYQPRRPPSGAVHVHPRVVAWPREHRASARNPSPTPDDHERASA